MRKHHSALGGAALVLALTLTGCGDDPDPKTQETPAETPSQTRTSTPTPKTPEEKAAAQLARYLKVRDEAYRNRDINLKTLNRVATGDEFLEIQTAVVEMTRGDVTKAGAYEHTLGDPRNRGNSIEITDCEDRSHLTIKVAGKVRDPDYTDPNGDALRNPAPVNYTLIQDKHVWKVSDSDLLWDQPC